jgi:hypothetical protein
MAAPPDEKRSPAVWEAGRANSQNINKEISTATAAKTQAKRSEVELTYAADLRDKRRNKRKPPIVWLRVAELERVFKDRYGASLPDDDAGRDDLWTALQHLALGADAVRRCQRFIKQWAPWMPEQETEEKMTAAIDKPYRFRAETLGKRIRLTDAERWKHGIKTIRSIDQDETPRQRKTRKQRERRAEARTGRQPPLSRSKPWEAEGICRRTWERRRCGDAKSEASISSLAIMLASPVCDRRSPAFAALGPLGRPAPPKAQRRTKRAVLRERGLAREESKKGGKQIKVEQSSDCLTMTATVSSAINRISQPSSQELWKGIC